MVMIAFKLEHHIKNELLMSVSTVTQIGAGVIFARFLPLMGQKTGMINSIYIGSLISAICALLLYSYHGYFLWLVTIFFLGTSFFICGVTRSTVMINLAPTHIRTLVISFGTMLVAVGNSCGPVILEITKTSESLSSFVIASGFFLASMLPLRRLKKIDCSIREEKKISLWRYIMNSPKIMFAGFAVHYAMSSMSAFLIIYGIQIGFPQSQAALLLSVLLFGTIFYIPLGYLTDILNRRMLMIFFSVLSLFLISQLYFCEDPQKIYILLFLSFGALSGMKLPAVVLINEKYKPTQRLAVNSAFSKFSLIGNILGLFCTGAFMKNFGPHGLWISVMMVLILFLIFCCFNFLKKFLRKEFKPRDLSFFNQKNNNELF